MLEKLVKKIRALQAKADSTTSEAEAAAFAAKVAELLSEYNLDPSVLRDRTEEDDKIGDKVHTHVNNGGWRTDLMAAVCKLYFCKITIWTRYEGRVARKDYHIHGKPHNVEVAHSMYDYLEKTILRLAKDYSTDRGSRLRFEKGCAFGLVRRITGQYENMKGGQTLLGDGSGLPALYESEEKLVQDYIDAMGLKDARKRTFQTANWDTVHGRRAADTINLGGQIGARSSTLLGSR